MDTSWRYCLRALLGLVLASAAGVGAAAASAFDPAQVVQVLKMELAAVNASADAGSRLRVEEALLDLDLVEVAGKGGSRLLVPGADFGLGKDQPAKPALRRRMIVDLVQAATSKAGEDEPAPASARAEGAVARVLDDLRSAFHPSVGTLAPWEFKRLGVELEFVVEADGKGAPLLVIFAAGRAVEPRNVQKLKLRLAAR